MTMHMHHSLLSLLAAAVASSKGLQTTELNPDMLLELHKTAYNLHL